MVVQTELADAPAPHLIDLVADSPRVVDPRVPFRVASCIEMFETRTALAQYLGVAKTQPGRWLKGAEMPASGALRLITDLDYLWARITAEMGAETARIWLRSSNPFLTGSAPLNWLKVHGAATVIEAFDAAEAGSYA